MQNAMKRIMRIAGIMLLIMAVYYFGLAHYFDLKAIKCYSDWFGNNLAEQYFVTVVLFTLFFAVLIAAALPIVAPLALMSGYLFGIFPGAVYSLIACVLGGMVSFLWMRKFFGASLHRRYAQRLEPFNRQIKTYGPSYLLVLHYSIILPLSLINTLAVIADLSLNAVLWTTTVGCFPILLVYAFAGQQLSTISTAREVLSPSIIVLFLMLACIAYMLPRIARRF